MILPAPYDYSPLLSTAQHCNLLIAFTMDAFDIDLSEIIPMVILGAVENAKEPKIPRNTGLPGERLPVESSSIVATINVSTASYECRRTPFICSVYGYERRVISKTLGIS